MSAGPCDGPDLLFGGEQDSGPLLRDVADAVDACLSGPEVRSSGQNSPTGCLSLAPTASPGPDDDAASTDDLVAAQQQMKMSAQDFTSLFMKPLTPPILSTPPRPKATRAGRPRTVTRNWC